MFDGSSQKMSYHGVGLRSIQETGPEAGLGTCCEVAGAGAHGLGLS